MPLFSNSEKAALRGQKHHDDNDAAHDQALRKLGRDIGRSKEYNKRADRMLKERGYKR